MEVPPKTKQFNKFNHKALLAFSIINIILALISCVLMTAALVPFSGGFSLSEADSTDMAGHGYWAGVFYLITGFVGYSASYKPTKSILVATLVLSAFSILTGIAATSLSGMTGGNVWSTRLCRYYDSDTGQYITDYHVCYVWSGLEWSLLGFSFLALICNIVVTSLVSKAVCCIKDPQRAQMPYYIVPINSTQGPWVSNQFMALQPVQIIPVQTLQQTPDLEQGQSAESILKVKEPEN